MLAICAVDMPVVFKAPKTSSKAESISQGINKATKGGSSKAPTSYKIGYSKKRKESSSAMDSDLSQPLVSTPVDTRMHKEDQQATGGPTSLGVTNEARANPQLSSGMDEGTKNTSFDHISAITDPHVLTDQTKSISEGLETVLTQPITRKGSNSIARQIKEEKASSTIKLEDLAKLVSNVLPSFKDLDSPEDDPVIIVDDSDKDEKMEKDEVHPTPNAKTEDSLHKLELEKNKAEAEATLLKAQPSFTNVEHLNELLVKSLQTEFSKNLSAHDFSSSLSTELKDLPSKFNELTKEVKTVQAKLKTLDALPSLLLNVTQALNKFAQVLDSDSSKAGDQIVPLAGQANTVPVEGEKNTNQATIF
ncbi:hypothetical protein Tco_0726244 [Tanacetum coccineum]|uniref:Uncharacterized protein n=1 Tax=Tanacetum coccineum TaxID=301880 RepID=A0ABQ4YF29_9ASTR